MCATAAHTAMRPQLPRSIPAGIASKAPLARGMQPHKASLSFAASGAIRKRWTSCTSVWAVRLLTALCRARRSIGARHALAACWDRNVRSPPLLPRARKLGEEHRPDRQQSTDHGFNTCCILHCFQTEAWFHFCAHTGVSGQSGPQCKCVAIESTICVPLWSDATSTACASQYGWGRR